MTPYAPIKWPKYEGLTEEERFDKEAKLFAKLVVIPFLILGISAGAYFVYHHYIKKDDKGWVESVFKQKKDTKNIETLINQKQEQAK